MSADKLYGTWTSPYVRQVRVAALELGVELEFCDTASEAGQRELRGLAPLWKVPVAQLDGELLYDSEVILAALSRRHPRSPLGPWLQSVPERNLKTVVDGALDSLINAFYLAREGLRPEQVPYLAKQHERAAAALRWVDERVAPMALAAPESFSWAVLSLTTALEWMVYRDAFAVGDFAGLSASLEAHRGRPSLVQTRPPEA